MNIKELTNKAIHNKTIRNGGLFSIFSFTNRGIGFVLLILLARFIQPEQYGELSLYTTYVELLGYFVGLSTAGYMSVSFFKETQDNFNKDFSAIFIITVVMSSLLCLILLLFRNHLSVWLKIDVGFLFLGLTTAFMITILQLNLDYLRIKEKVSKYGVLSCGYALLNFILSLYLVINKDLNWQGRVYAQSLSALLLFIIAIVCFSKRKMLCFTKSWGRYKAILIWGIPLIPHLVSNWVRQGLDRYIIDASHSTADVGIFSFALTLSGIIGMVGMAFNATNSVNIYQVLSSNINNKDKLLKLKKEERLIFCIYAVSAIVVVIGGTFFVPIVLPKYSSAIPYMLILSVYEFIRCLYFLVCNYLFYYNATKELMLITVTSSVLHLILSLLFTRYSLYLTSVIYIISFSCVLFFVYIKSRKLIKEKIPID